MIDTTKLQSSSLFAGFASIGTDYGSVGVPANQLVPGFSGGAFSWFMEFKRPSAQTMAQARFQLIGPSTVNGDPHDPNRQKSSTSSYVVWRLPDGYNFEIRCEIYRYTSDRVQIRISYATLQIADQTYPTAVTINCNIYFFKYPWE